jgi:hypothetical protein
MLTSVNETSAMAAAVAASAAHSCNAGSGTSGTGRPRQRADHGHSGPRGEIEKRSGEGRRRNRNQDTGCLRCPAPASQNHGERKRADRHRGGVGPAGKYTARQFAHLLHECFAMYGKAEELRQLAEKDRQLDAVQITMTDRRREQIRDKAQSQQTNRCRSHQTAAQAPQRA